ncbi:succinylglutamate desuccinylase/aspartoacylase family protein [Allomuricauda sp. SCSIO 65647]|uniref:succinylglutamate desuccinylase/aspartoacylase family protein n=1 Tax=Allomuricauda sp. SCSIO 65647 TaxID=2908843 RepID=UPI001F3A7A6A|nr:succinylglutamate desuccinylase/aspartoacylase family protein [Muricauda sp. SCSIO 65647]UJH68463.1 succinylglutamate desuccinylase/aspartoacylase family protein [Muricauda sp. SCSIO 65647]
MPEVYSKALGSSLKVNRVLGHLKGKEPGPTVIFFGGIHGNEPAGIFALDEVLQQLQSKNIAIKGEFFAIAGNLPALQKSIRFHQEDLNRIWKPERIAQLGDKSSLESDDAKEMQQLMKLLNQLFKKTRPPYYFIDLHTTSGETDPFIVVNDSLLNRKFVSNYPLPTILGIEEYLTGAMLSYINELGYVSFGYESGQHDHTMAIKKSVDFIKYTLALTGVVSVDETSLAALKNKVADSCKEPHTFYEIYYQHKIGPQDCFDMLPGFVNFQKVPKDKPIAVNGQGVIKTTKPRQLFMPLYQKKGSEGFYFIREIPRFFLWLSKWLRKIHADHVLTLLPGLKWVDKEKSALMVNRNVARFMAKPVFHLLGYRTRFFDKDHLIIRSRERNSKEKEYIDEKWY